MGAVRLPPNPYLDRRSVHPAGEVDHERNARTVTMVLLTLLGILGVAAGGGAIFILPDYLEQKRLEERMGPAFNLFDLPPLKIEMGGGDRLVDLSLRIQLDPKYDKNRIEPYTDRITERIGDRIRDVGLERLSGAAGAMTIKDMAKSVVQQEVKGVKIQDVLIQNLNIGTPYS